MRPPATARSVARGPSGVNTVPPRTTRSAGGTVGPPEEGPEGDLGPCERLGGSLLAVEDADHGDHLAAGGAHLLDGVQGRAAGGQHVLEDSDPVTGLHHA